MIVFSLDSFFNTLYLLTYQFFVIPIFMSIAFIIYITLTRFVNIHSYYNMSKFALGISFKVFSYMCINCGQISLGSYWCQNCGKNYFIDIVQNLYNRNLAIVKMEHLCNTKTLIIINKIKKLNHKIDKS